MVQTLNKKENKEVIKIPDGVEEITSTYFKGFRSPDDVKEIILPESVKTIHIDAFRNFANLGAINLENVEEIKGEPYNQIPLNIEKVNITALRKITMRALSLLLKRAQVITLGPNTDKIVVNYASGLYRFYVNIKSFSLKNCQINVLVTPNNINTVTRLALMLNEIKPTNIDTSELIPYLEYCQTLGSLAHNSNIINFMAKYLDKYEAADLKEGYEVLLNMERQLEKLKMNYPNIDNSEAREMLKDTIKETEKNIYDLWTNESWEIARGKEEYRNFLVRKDLDTYIKKMQQLNTRLCELENSLTFRSFSDSLTAFENLIYEYKEFDDDYNDILNSSEVNAQMALIYHNILRNNFMNLYEVIKRYGPTDEKFVMEINDVKRLYTKI